MARHNHDRGDNTMAMVAVTVVAAALVMVGTPL